jgi:hypothetical protein
MRAPRVVRLLLVRAPGGTRRPSRAAATVRGNFSRGIPQRTVADCGPGTPVLRGATHRHEREAREPNDSDEKPATADIKRRAKKAPRRRCQERMGPVTRLRSGSARTRLSRWWPTTVAAIPPAYDLAERYGIHRKTVSARLRARGMRPGHQPLSQEEITRARTLRDQGLSLNAIGRAIGRDPKTVKPATILSPADSA